MMTSVNQSPDAGPPCVVFEDRHLLVVSKPAGWNTHAPAPYAGEGIYDWLRHREPRWASLAIVHRLDKETSGLLVFGKTPQANKSLTEQFTRREVEKTYLLVTDRPVARENWTTESEIRRAGDHYVACPPGQGGEPAETRFRVIRREPERVWIEAKPVTGRTHQIRVHAAAEGLPILGDTLYGGSAFPRVCLHAAKLSFQHPLTGEPAQVFESAPDFDRAPAEALREAFIARQDTDAFRRRHGAADHCPGLYAEQLGKYVLTQAERPPTPAEVSSLAPGGLYHKTLIRHVRQTTTAETSPQPVASELAPERFVVRENGVAYELSFAEGYSVGLFLDQRDNRRRLLTNHVAAGFPLFPEGAAGREVLNCFAYTCAFSVCAARGGVRATSLDLSRKYLDWGRRNFSLNGLDPAAHDFIFGDVFDWLRRLGKKGRQFDAVLLDPPTFSRSKEHGEFRAANDYGELVTHALRVLKPQGVLFASTNAAGLAPEKFLAQVQAAITGAGRRVLREHYVPQPPDFPISRDEPAYLKTVWLRVA
jgi:23S rRNA (cytosine1962-C5)-methyltransferase